MDKAVSDQEEATSTLLLTEEPYKELPLTYIPSKPFSELEEELESWGRSILALMLKAMRI